MTTGTDDWLGNVFIKVNDMLDELPPWAHVVITGSRSHSIREEEHQEHQERQTDSKAPSSMG